MTEATFTAGMVVGIFMAIPVLLLAERLLPDLLERLRKALDPTRCICGVSLASGALCERCVGTGQDNDGQCPHCHGTGKHHFPLRDLVLVTRRSVLWRPNGQCRRWWQFWRRPS